MGGIKVLGFMQRSQVDFWSMGLLLSRVFLFGGALIVIAVVQEWKWLAVVGQLGFTFFVSERYWYAYTIKYNTRSAVIIWNRWQRHHHFRFDTIEGVVCEDSKLKIDSLDNKRQHINVSKFHKDDI